MIRIAIPNKGRLHEPTLALFKDAGLPVYGGGHESRQLISKTTDPEITFIFARAADIPLYVEEGTADIGITGLDLVTERKADVECLIDLKYGSSRLILAIPETSEIQKPEELSGKRVATEFPEITKQYFEFNKIKDVEVIQVSGACEMTPHIGVAEAIVDITSSGTTMMINKLKAIDVVFDSKVFLIANKKSLAAQEKIKDVEMALESVLLAKTKRYIMMNVPAASLKDVEKVIPGMNGPTVMEVQGAEPMFAVHAVVDADTIFAIVRKLKILGARDILVLPVERLIP
ncbi:ATP phosphoribosyltransferase [Methanimicrococcus blatticola]|uniref:ATP phosphoribosyltransferase n=1 Tax=Methanimicrococcus blatticola TaxID=91560 RepID=A0A484F4V8_9EURY|nr:ATP phosphoribosyltransferase [Methanimicrococcus blatticola]MBZ3935265.1 ATP phosphoribosyltransferase [Methanimicrococcus blatticola]MCC2508637.1 ATP phosphoribosyltransferase [Methanimicrococcus blatticola]TDQ67942.1 ATP phosphoribosyltransferase (homohexameric) [Methanimicrococcus blatticola]